MAQRLSQVEFVNQLKNRPMGVSEEDFVRGLLRSGQVASEDLKKWNALAAYDRSSQPQIDRGEFNRQTARMTSAQRDAHAADLQRKGFVIEGYRPPEEQDRRYQEALKRGDQPSMLRHPAAWWKWHTPNEKQQILNNTGEFAGGTVAGALATAASGGNPAVAGPAAGAGAVVGKETARGLGRAAGIDSDDHSSPGDMAQTFILNATGEALGSMPAFALAKLRPTARAEAVAQLWDRMGIPMTLSQRSGNDLAAMTEHGVGKIPLLGRIVKNANAKAYDALEAWVESRLKGIHPNAVGREELADLVRQGMGAARQSFNTAMDSELSQVARNVHPSAQTAKSAGKTLKAGVKRNLETMSDYGEANFPRLIKAGENIELPSERLADVMETYRQMSDPAKALMPEKAKSVFEKLSQALDPEVTPDVVTGADALNIRAGLNDVISKVDPRSPDRALISKLKSSIDHAIAGGPPSWADDVAQVTEDYARAAQQVSPKRGPQNNPMARTVDRAAEPETLATGLVKPNRSSAVEMANAATNPDSVRHMDPTVPVDRPVDAVGRYAVDTAGQESNLATGRTSPGWLRKRMDGPGWRETYDALLGRANADSLDDVARPANVAREGELFNSPLARAADTPNEGADPVFREMFPKRSTQNAVDANLSYLPNRAQGERALAQDIVEQSRARPGAGKMTRGTGYGTESMLTSGKMKGQLDAYGDTVDHTLGPDAGGLRDAQSALSQMEEPVSVWGNPSNTAQSHMVLTALTHPIHTAAAIPSLMLGIPSAKALVSPKVAKAVTGAAKSPLLPWMQRVGGALTRGLDFTQSASPEKPAQKPADSTPPPIPGVDDQPKADVAMPPIPGVDPVTADDWAKKHMQ